MRYICRLLACEYPGIIYKKGRQIKHEHKKYLEQFGHGDPDPAFVIRIRDYVTAFPILALLHVVFIPAFDNKWNASRSIAKLRHFDPNLLPYRIQIVCDKLRMFSIMRSRNVCINVFMHSSACICTCILMYVCTRKGRQACLHKCFNTYT